MRQKPYVDRADAGAVLAADERLTCLAGRDVVMLALPRGGVPVALPVARALGAALDVVIVRRLGVPGHEELAMGAWRASATPSSLSAAAGSPIGCRMRRTSPCIAANWRRCATSTSGFARADLTCPSGAGSRCSSTTGWRRVHHRAAIAAVRTQQPEARRRGGARRVGGRLRLDRAGGGRVRLCVGPAGLRGRRPGLSRLRRRPPTPRSSAPLG